MPTSSSQVLHTQRTAPALSTERWVSVRSHTLHTIAAAALLCAGSLMLASSAQAQAQSTTANDVLLRQEQERLRQEQERLRRPQTPSGVDLKTYAPQTTKAAEGGVCHTINRIDLSGAELLDDEDRASVSARFVEKCLSARDIENLMGEVTRHYIERGFVTSRAYLPSQDLSKGQLRLLVLEGRIERLEVSGDPDGRINLNTAVPAQAGDLLNMRDLEQAVDQINATPGNQVKLDLVPGSEPGKTVVVFRNEAARPVKVNLSHNNQGNPSTGRDSFSLGLTTGSLLGLGEILDFTGRTSIPTSDVEKSSSSLSLGMTLPSGYTTYSFAVSQSKFSTGFDTQLGQHLISSGTSTSVDLKAERVMMRDQQGRHAVTFAYNASDSKTYVDEALLSVSTHRFHNFGIGTNSVVNTWEGVLTVKPEIVVGLAAQNNLPIGVNPSSDGPQAQFAKATLELNFNRSFKVANQDMAWNTTFKGQHSNHTLFGAQQFLIGSSSSVRAFPYDSLSGDSGMYWRNDLSLNKRFSVGSQEVSARWYAGLDMGHVRSHVDTGTSAGTNGSMTGAIAGVSTQVGAFTVDISVTRPLHSTDSNAKKAHKAWLTLSAAL